MDTRRLESLTRHYLALDSLQSARFYADKLVTIEKGSARSVYLLSEIMFRNEEYRRTVHLLQSHDLLPSFDDHRTRKSSPISMCLGNRSKSVEIRDDRDRDEKSREMQSQECLLLAMNCLYKCGEYEESLSLLGMQDNVALSRIQIPQTLHAMEKENTALSQRARLSSCICVIRAKIFEKLDNHERAVFWYEHALRFDSTNFEAFDKLVSRRMITLKRAEEIVQALSIPVDLDWVSSFYQLKIHELSPTFLIFDEKESDEQSHENPIMKIMIDGPSEDTDPLWSSTDYQTLIANSHHNKNSFIQCLKITSQVLDQNPFTMEILPSHIGCLVELGKQAELYNLAHQLVETYPTHAISWYAVGAYYYVIGTHENARRFLSKSTKLDKYFLPSWILWGHTFTEQDAHDPAMSAYRSAHRMFPGAHVPIVCIAMEYLQMQNLVHATKFLEKARALCPRDPLVFCELGVVMFNQGRFEESCKYLTECISLLSRDLNHDSWKTAFVNLGHVHRKLKHYDQAIECYQEALSVDPNDPIVLTSIGFTKHLMGEIDDAIEYYHKSLSIEPTHTFTNDMLNRAFLECVTG